MDAGWFQIHAFCRLESWESCDILKFYGDTFKSDAIVQPSAEALSGISQDEGSEKSVEEAAVSNGDIRYRERLRHW